MPRQETDTRVRLLRVAMQRETDLTRIGERFGLLMEDRGFIERSVRRDDEVATGVADLVRQTVEAQGHVLPGEMTPARTMVLEYRRGGLLHGNFLVSPVVAFCYFERMRKGLIVVSRYSGETDYYRFEWALVSDQPIGLPGVATLQ